MKKFGEWIAKHKGLVLIIGVLLLIPSAFGYLNTRVNYDILSYLPKDINTMVGQDILIDEFGKGGFSFCWTVCRKRMSGRLQMRSERLTVWLRFFAMNL